MKLSARNAIPGTVVAITKGVIMSQVKIEVAAGLIINAAITNEAAEALELAVGKPATAIIKSSDVIVAVA